MGAITGRPIGAVPEWSLRWRSGITACALSGALGLRRCGDPKRAVSHAGRYSIHRSEALIELVPGQPGRPKRRPLNGSRRADLTTPSVRGPLPFHARARRSTARSPAGGSRVAGRRFEDPFDPIPHHRVEAVDGGRQGVVVAHVVACSLVDRAREAVRAPERRWRRYEVVGRLRRRSGGADPLSALSLRAQKAVICGSVITEKSEIDRIPTNTGIRPPFLYAAVIKELFSLT